GLAQELDREAVDAVVQGLDRSGADERQAEPWEADALVVHARAEGEQVEVLQRVSGVCHPRRVVEDAVARTDLVRLAVLPRQPATCEDVEDLLLTPVLVRGRRPAPGRYLEPPDADAHAARGLAEEGPRRMQVADLPLSPVRLVEVRDPHGRSLRSHDRAARGSRPPASSPNEGLEWPRVQGCGFGRDPNGRGAACVLSRGADGGACCSLSLFASWTEIL